MQTFLPVPNFSQTAKILDYKRLGKQRVEAFTILKVLNNKTIGWINHPIVKMWTNYKESLTLYMNTCIIEWINRGYKNNMEIIQISNKIIMPKWLGDERLHSSHRANLLRKDFNYYSQFNWSEQPSNKYFWPI